MKLTLFLLLALSSLLVMATQAKKGGVFKTKLTRVVSQREKMMAEGTWSQFYQKMQSDIKTQSQGPDGNTAKVPLKGYYDTVYTAHVSIGVPQQHFSVFMDTGSANPWVVDTDCAERTCTGSCCQFFDKTTCQIFGCSSNCCDQCPGLPPGFDMLKKKYSRPNDRLFTDPCAHKNKFVSASSTTYQKDGTAFSISYNSGVLKGTAQGFLGKDVYCVGTDLCSTPQTFAQIGKLSPNFAYLPMDGVLGLAFSTISVDHVQPVFDGLIPQLSADIFTVWSTKTSTSGATAGQITFGDYDSSNCNMGATGQNLTWIPVYRPVYWEFVITGFQAGGDITQFAPRLAIIDTGTSFIAGLKSTLDGIARVVGATYDAPNGLYTIPCAATPPPVSFTTRTNVTFTVTYQNYIIQPAGKAQSGTCLFAFEPKSQEELGGIGFILGDTFVRQYCTVFDFGNKRLGFALAKH